MDLKKCVVMASGKMRQCAFDKLNSEVQLLGWQQGGRMPKEQFDAWLAQADALFSTGNIRIDEKLLAKSPKLKVIAQASVGYDNIDIAACAARGIPVGNTPGVLVDAVADLAYGLIIDSARRLVRAHAHVQSGAWGERKPFGLTTDLAGKVLGIIGMGDIGSAIAKRAQASSMQVIYHNRHQRSDDEKLNVKYVSQEELLATADFIVLAVTLNPSTKHLINAETIAKMKQGVRLINISRGGVVDTEALYDALVSGQIGYAAMDVTDPEPLPGEHKLLSLENVTVTPHMASATKETRDAMALLTAENILAGLKGEALPAQVPVK
ncbi:MAG: 2-hydroxyacid dehydrogenase [Phascolarctobacterium sp.]